MAVRLQKKEPDYPDADRRRDDALTRTLSMPPELKNPTIKKSKRTKKLPLA